MDSTRISIARVLTLDVPLTWQDAVAVAQEVAMLSEVSAAMNDRPSLVTPESCFITREGDVELPDTTDREAPEDVARLLRDLIAGRDAPPELETLARTPSTESDLSESLGALAVGNRRTRIAQLASRALTIAAAPMTPRAPEAPPAPAIADTADEPSTPPAVVRAFTRSPGPRPAPEPARPALPPLVLAAPTPQRPPFVATPTPAPMMPQAPPPAMPPAQPAAAAAAATAPAMPASEIASAPAPDAELRRLRHRSRERERPGRLAALVRRAVPWITWRHESSDPRVLGGAAVVIAALVAMVWRNDAGSMLPGERPVVPARAAVTSPDRLDPAGAAVPVVAPPAPETAAPPAPTAPPVTTPAIAAPRPRPAASEARRNVDSAAPEAPATPTSAAPRTDPTPAATTTAATPPATLPAPAVEPPRRTPDLASTPPSRSASGRGTLYSATDAAVTPPVMRRQQLPSNLLEPTADVPEDWPFLEIVVDERGAVEAVRLRAKTVAPGQTMYRHRMLLAAAKAWQFEPATKDGVAVRYLMRVPLEP